MKILVIRLDLIGDLIATTPIFSALKHNIPNVVVDALVNTYNHPVIAHNPNIDNIHLYKKTSHTNNIFKVITSFLNNKIIKTRIKNLRYDYAILCNSGPAHKAIKVISNCKIKNTIGYTDEGTKSKINIPVPKYNGTDRHEVNVLFNLLKPLGIEGTPDPVKIYQTNKDKEWAKQIYQLKMKNNPNKNNIIGLQISSRRAHESWSIERWAQLSIICTKKYNLNLMIFWAPGTIKNKTHPGDDEKAAELSTRLRKSNVKFIPFPTKSLPEIFAGIGLCDIIVTSDGGAMHIAGALDKKIVSFMHKNQYPSWHPWSDKYHTFTYSKSSEEDIHIDEVSKAIGMMIDK